MNHDYYCILLFYLLLLFFIYIIIFHLFIIIFYLFLFIYLFLFYFQFAISILKFVFYKKPEPKFTNLVFTLLLCLASASPLGEVELVRQRLLLGLCLSVGVPFWTSLPGCAGHLHAAVAASGGGRSTGEDTGEDPSRHKNSRGHGWI